MKFDWPPIIGKEQEKTESPVVSSSRENKNRFKKIPLTEEDRNLSGVEFANKYGLSIKSACDIKKQGYRSMPFSRQPLNEKQIERRKELKMKIGEIEHLEINSIETALVTSNEQEKIKKIVEEYNTVLNESGLKNQKLFKLENGKEISLGDLVVLDKIAEKRVFRDENDQLMMFDKNEDKFIPFNPRSFFGQKKSYNFRDNFKGVNTESKKARYSIIALESFAPQVFKLGIFKDKDFDKRSAGSISYEINGPHERSLSKTSPSVFFSSTNSRANYYIGKDKFVGTDKKINHETVRVSLLDNNTGVVTDIVNRRKIILYTFPLLSKEQYEEKKEKVIQKQINQKRINDYITESASLKEYSITDYISKNSNESDKDYNERISKLSDLSYVLGNFRSFMSETGLAANNYSWKEQLVLANALTSVGSEEKIKKFGGSFGKNGLRTFLSIEQGGKEMGNKILELGEKLPEGVAKKVFEKYGQIIDNVNKISDFAKSNFTKEIETSPELIKKIEETLYSRGKQLLSQIHDDINNEKKTDYEDIGQQLDRINADTLTTFAIFKQAIKNGENLPIESIEGSVFAKKDAKNISDEQRKEMNDLYDRNYKDHSDREFISKVKDYFNTAFSPESNLDKNYFYTFEKDLKIRAFVRFEKKEDKSLYASALNIDEASKNFGLGEAMMDEALSSEARESVLRATCLIDSPSNMRYFEKGFISKGFKPVDKTNQLDLVWDEKKNKNIISKQKTQEELITMYGSVNAQNIEIRKSKDLESLHREMPEGKALTRCFLNNGEWYASYEKVNDDYGVNLEDVR